MVLLTRRKPCRSLLPVGLQPKVTLQHSNDLREWIGSCGLFLRFPSLKSYRAFRFKPAHWIVSTNKLSGRAAQEMTESNRTESNCSTPEITWATTVHSALTAVSRESLWADPHRVHYNTQALILPRYGPDESSTSKLCTRCCRGSATPCSIGR